MMEVRIREPMKAHTTFRVGGEADWFVLPGTTEELKAVLSVCEKTGTDWYVIGNGSNLLVSDEGYRGVIICTERLGGPPAAEGTKVRAGAGVLLSALAAFCQQRGLSGLEFASGIPGSVGGAVVMNAGAYGSELGDVLLSADVLTPEGSVKRLSREELRLGYRKSVIQEEQYLVLAAEFSLEEGEPAAILEKMRELGGRRREKQPLQYPSAGSTFKRPEGYYAGRLIEEAGLKGFRVGGAAVSEKHAGFVINEGDASAADILKLCREIKRRVYLRSGVSLELEVKLLGNF